MDCRSSASRLQLCTACLPCYLPKFTGSGTRATRRAWRGQLALYDLSWRDVWLTPAEREIVSVQEEHFINDVLADNAAFDAETRVKPFVPADQAAALLEIFDDDAVAAVVRAKLGSRFEACAATVEAGGRATTLGVRIRSVVDDLRRGPRAAKTACSSAAAASTRRADGVATASNLECRINCSAKQHQMPRARVRRRSLRDGACNAASAPDACWRRRTLCHQ